MTDNRLGNLYHKGQDLIWDGNKLFDKLLEEHGGIDIPADKARALHNIFSTIYWGELAAWKISAALALQIDDDGARLAATSQAHDEARHFYTMERYLKTIGEQPKQIDTYSANFLKSVLSAGNVAKMLLGMQLMVEPLALTLFKLVREKQIEPVLSDLLLMYERDEARHVALGTLYLPHVLARMSFLEKADLLLWQFKEYMRQFNMLKARSADFIALGIKPRTVFDIARDKQLKAMELMSVEMGKRYPLMDTMIRVINFRGEWDFPVEETDSLTKWKLALLALSRKK